MIQACLLESERKELKNMLGLFVSVHFRELSVL